jgi:transposase InsO family protein
MKDHMQEYTVEKMCKVFDLRRSGFYHWLNRKPSKSSTERRALSAEIKDLYTGSKGRYGSPKITICLRDRGFKASRPRVARIMKSLGLHSIISRKFKVCTTDSNHGFRISQNILDRNFTPKGSSQAWVSDITYIRTGQGWLYLTVIMDLYDRKIIGWSMSSSLRASETVVPAWRMAVLNRGFSNGLIFHSDRGVQYACDEFRGCLDNKKIIQSMSRKGNCWDNSVAENFFKILKSETSYKRYDTLRQAKQEIFEFIEIWYNRIRKHSALGYLSPEQFGKENHKTNYNGNQKNQTSKL